MRTQRDHRVRDQDKNKNKDKRESKRQRRNSTGRWTASKGNDMADNTMVGGGKKEQKK